MSCIMISANRRSEEHTSELQSRLQIVCRLLLEKKKDGDHDVIDRPATAEEIDDAFIAGDIGWDRDGVQPGCDRIQAVNIAGCNNNIGPFPLGEFGGRKTDTRRAS